jgi:hypothetical protein
MLERRPSIVAVIERYVSLRKSGHSFVGRCPFHDDQHPSFTVSEDKGVFYCHGCHAGGDVIRFVELIEPTDFKGALKILGIEGGEFKPKPKDPRKQQAARRRHPGIFRQRTSFSPQDDAGRTEAPVCRQAGFRRWLDTRSDRALEEATMLTYGEVIEIGEKGERLGCWRMAYPELAGDLGLRVLGNGWKSLPVAELETMAAVAPIIAEIRAREVVETP